MDYMFTYEMQYYLEFMNGSGVYDKPVRITEDKEFTPSRDKSSYDGSYLCNRVTRTIVTATKDTFAFTIDAVGPGGIQKRLAAIEDTRNVPARLVRTSAYDFEAEKACDANALVAKRVEVKVNMDPMDGAFGELCTFSGEIVQDSDEWEWGTFDPSTGAFTPKA